MIDDPSLPDTPQERAAIVAWRLAIGEELTTLDVAYSTGLSIRRSQELLNELSRVVPIHCVAGLWQHALLSRNGKN